MPAINTTVDIHYVNEYQNLNIGCVNVIKIWYVKYMLKNMRVMGIKWRLAITVLIVNLGFLAINITSWLIKDCLSTLDKF